MTFLCCCTKHLQTHTTFRWFRLGRFVQRLQWYCESGINLKALWYLGLIKIRYNKLNELFCGSSVTWLCCNAANHQTLFSLSIMATWWCRNAPFAERSPLCLKDSKTEVALTVSHCLIQFFVFYIQSIIQSQHNEFVPLHMEQRACDHWVCALYLLLQKRLCCFPCCLHHSWLRQTPDSLWYSGFQFKQNDDI